MLIRKVRHCVAFSVLLNAGCHGVFELQEVELDLDAFTLGCPDTYTRLGDGYYRFVSAAVTFDAKPTARPTSWVALRIPISP